MHYHTPMPLLAYTTVKPPRRPGWPDEERVTTGMRAAAHGSRKKSYCMYNASLQGGKAEAGMCSLLKELGQSLESRPRPVSTQPDRSTTLGGFSPIRCNSPILSFCGRTT